MRYVDFIVDQLEQDARVLNSPWMFLGVPLVLYVIYAFFKWYVLLAPVTVPLTILMAREQNRKG